MWRYERKYRLDQIEIQSIHQIIRQHPAAFRKHFPDRQVNNIYFDTPGFQTFLDNQTGVLSRRKFRLRWYGSACTQINKPVFEIKSKHNGLGKKDSYALSTIDWQAVKSIFTKIEVEFDLPFALQPTLVNSYQRSYYQSLDGQFRITVDTEMKFGAFHHKPLPPQIMVDDIVVLELKYLPEKEDQVSGITQYLPFHITKNSKYSTGISLVYN